jgi:murein DD-endopeptidase MepM/ murein hydrolase activator NlpD
MDAQGRWVVGDPDRNRSWVFFDKPVLAVADATVVAVVDRYPDQIPNHPGPVTIRSADGNHVILRLGPHRYASYAHLVPGSIRVHQGQRVHEGQVIARLGNSGSSTGPHLHIQLSTRPSFLDGDGLPFAIRSFRLQGRIPPLTDALQALVNGGGATPPTGPSGRKHDVLPVGRDVVAFARR